MSNATPRGQNRFLILLIALSLLMTCYPLGEAGGLRSRVIFQASFDLVLFAGLFSMRRAGRWLWVGVALATPAIVIVWSGVIFPQPSVWTSRAVSSAGSFAMAFYLILLVLFILRDLFSSSTVTTDRLCGALSAYMLMGIAWGFLHTGLEISAPGSYGIGESLEQLNMSVEGPLARSSVLFYFSFVTLTTLGYGDVSPNAPTAQMFTMWEALLGQAYLTILVARLVGLHVSTVRLAPDKEPGLNS